MSNLKRFLAITLAIVMVVSGMAMSVSAAKPTDVKDADLAYALEVLAGLDIVKGIEEDTAAGTFVFGGELDVTREQFALFVARVRTGNPDWFVVGETDVVPTTEFTDDADIGTVYKSAVADCVENGIILGREDGRFDPQGKITLQEAVTMLARALGYTGLSYPMGFLTKAVEIDVELFGERAEFALADVRPTQVITRADMGMLLYNFLLSNYSTLEVWWNAVEGRYNNRDVLYPVLNRFGIQKITGYVTGIPNWSIDLLIEDYNRTGYFADGVLLEGANANPQRARNPYNIEIKWATPKKVGSGATTQYTGWESGVNDYLHTNVASLGFKEYDKDDEAAFLDYLLGLKVIVYQDTSVTRDRAIPYSKVVGKKSEVDISETKATLGLNDAGDAVSWQSALTLNGIDYTALGGGITPGGPEDFNPNYNLYMWNYDKEKFRFNPSKADGLLREGSALSELAKFANMAANYRLEYVYNGDDLRGNPEFFYVFRPFQVGRRGANHGDWPNRVQFTTPDNVADSLTTDVMKDQGLGDKGKYPASGDAIVRPMKGWVPEAERTTGYWAVGDAYFFTSYGKNIDLYGKLNAVPNATVVARSGSRVTFIIEDTAKVKTSKEFNFNYTNTWSRTLRSALSGGGFGDNMNDTYTLYLDPKTELPLVAWRSTNYNDPVGNNYAVILQGMSNAVYVAGEGGMFYPVRVYDVSLQRERVILVDRVNGTPLTKTGSFYDAIQSASANGFGFVVSENSVDYWGMSGVVALKDNDRNLVTFNNNGTPAPVAEVYGVQTGFTGREEYAGGYTTGGVINETALAKEILENRRLDIPLAEGKADNSGAGATSADQWKETLSAGRGGLKTFMTNAVDQRALVDSNTQLIVFSPAGATGAGTSGASFNENNTVVGVYRGFDTLNTLLNGLGKASGLSGIRSLVFVGNTVNRAAKYVFVTLASDVTLEEAIDVVPIYFATWGVITSRNGSDVRNDTKTTVTLYNVRTYGSDGKFTNVEIWLDGNDTAGEAIGSFVRLRDETVVGVNITDHREYPTTADIFNYGTPPTPIGEFLANTRETPSGSTVSADMNTLLKDTLKTTTPGLESEANVFMVYGTTDGKDAVDGNRILINGTPFTLDGKVKARVINYQTGAAGAAGRILSIDNDRDLTKDAFNDLVEVVYDRTATGGGKRDNISLGGVTLTNPTRISAVIYMVDDGTGYKVMNVTLVRVWDSTP